MKYLDLNLINGLIEIEADSLAVDCTTDTERELDRYIELHSGITIKVTDEQAEKLSETWTIN